MNTRALLRRRRNKITDDVLEYFNFQFSMITNTQAEQVKRDLDVFLLEESRKIQRDFIKIKNRGND